MTAKAMWILRSVWKDILWLNARRPFAKIAGLLVLVGLIVGAWYLGGDWWNVTVYMPKGGRPVPRWQFWASYFWLVLLIYMFHVADRDHSGR
jgi:hypothetical protein